MKNKINYNKFKNEIVKYILFKGSSGFDEEELNDLYTEFKIMWFGTVKEFCEFYFQDCHLSTHDFVLRSKITIVKL